MGELTTLFIEFCLLMYESEEFDFGCSRLPFYWWFDSLQRDRYGKRCDFEKEKYDCNGL